MKAKIDNKLLALIRVKGSAGTRRSINETLARLNLKRVNNLTLLYGTPSNIGMITKCNDFITYGEVTQELLQEMVERKKLQATSDDIRLLLDGKKSAKELTNLPIRMHPPRKGYEGIKRGYSNKGALGYRGEKIAELIQRMM